MSLSLALDKRLVGLNFQKQAVASTSYFLLIDLNNASGEYAHQPGNGIYIGGAISGVEKDTATDDWIVQAGIVLSINGTEAVVTWLTIGTVLLRSTDVLKLDRQAIAAPLALNTTVVSGQLSGMASNSNETIPALNTGTPIEDVSGVPQPVEVGDMILRVQKVSGEGTLDFSTVIWYWVE